MMTDNPKAVPKPEHKPIVDFPQAVVTVIIIFIFVGLLAIFTQGLVRKLYPDLRVIIIPTVKDNYMGSTETLPLHPAIVQGNTAPPR